VLSANHDFIAVWIYFGTCSSAPCSTFIYIDSTFIYIDQAPAFGRQVLWAAPSGRRPRPSEPGLGRSGAGRPERKQKATVSQVAQTWTRGSGPPTTSCLQSTVGRPTGRQRAVGNGAHEHNWGSATFSPVAAVWHCSSTSDGLERAWSRMDGADLLGTNGLGSSSIDFGRVALIVNVARP